MTYPKTPTNCQTCKLYAEYLADIHKEKFYPIERTIKIKSKFAINFAAVNSEELPHYMLDGWERII